MARRHESRAAATPAAGVVVVPGTAVPASGEALERLGPPVATALRVAPIAPPERAVAS
jgi:hypothetical protein